MGEDSIISVYKPEIKIAYFINSINIKSTFLVIDRFEIIELPL